MNLLPEKVEAALVAFFNERHKTFVARSGNIGAGIVDCVNAERDMGMTLRQLTGREVVTEQSLKDWLRLHPGALAEEELCWLMNFVKIAGRYTEEVKTFDELRAHSLNDTLQLTFQCAGLLPLPERGVEERHEVTPDIAVWNCVTTLKTHLTRTFSGAQTWDSDQRQAVREHIRKGRVLLDEFEQRLNGA